ncbi:cobalamin binding intrinsic factor-like [Ruditapes philippinarum]|uniref:cobalamin binding intrinsic factor-like n=1 Tax=Ruditapes philippinarum TaxID=129788 RepID=UPI00295AEBB9|nr:cobalamin binding intrinsic factor-like [Ruditapes philippinarum]
MDMKCIIFVLCLTITVSWSKQKHDCLENGPSCKRQFKYTINNQLQSPYFRASIVLRVYPRVTMIRYMEQSVLQKPKEFVNFRAKFTAPYGYFVEMIHDLTGTYTVNKTYWQISNSSGPLDVGVSSYIPSAGDAVLFNFTQG